MGNGLCDVFVYRTGADGFTGSLLAESSAEDPFGAVVVVQLKLALDFLDDVDLLSMSSTVQSLETLLRVHSAIWWRVEAQARIDGESVRAKVLFFPRFIVRTFPKANSDKQRAERNKVLEKLSYGGVGLTSLDAADYGAFVDRIIAS